MKRILVTGARSWTDWAAISSAIRAELPPGGAVVVVHGGATGADQIAKEVATGMGIGNEQHWAGDFTSPIARNRYMVNLGADVCLAFALTWASGTGATARMARKAGIPVIDYGVDTRSESRPVSYRPAA